MNDSMDEVAMGATGMHRFQQDLKRSPVTHLALNWQHTSLGL